MPAVFLLVNTIGRSFVAVGSFFVKRFSSMALDILPISIYSPSYSVHSLLAKNVPKVKKLDLSSLCQVQCTGWPHWHICRVMGCGVSPFYRTCRRYPVQHTGFNEHGARCFGQGWGCSESAVCFIPNVSGLFGCTAFSLKGEGSRRKDR